MRMTKNAAMGLAFGLGILSVGAVAAESTGPADRVISDPLAVASPANENARPIPIEDLYFTQTLSNRSWSPDGKEIAFTTDASGRSNLWKVSAAGGWPVQLVQSDERAANDAWSPDGKWIVFQQDVGGNELWNLFAVPSDGGTVVNLTQMPNIREEAPRWSPDGRTIAFNYKPKEGSNYDLALLDFAGRKVSKLTDEALPNFNWN